MIRKTVKETLINSAFPAIQLYIAKINDSQAIKQRHNIQDDIGDEYEISNYQHPSI